MLCSSRELIDYQNDFEGMKTEDDIGFFDDLLLTPGTWLFAFGRYADA